MVWVNCGVEGWSWRGEQHHQLVDPRSSNNTRERIITSHMKTLRIIRNYNKITKSIKQSINRIGDQLGSPDGDREWKRRCLRHPQRNSQHFHVELLAGHFLTDGLSIFSSLPSSLLLCFFVRSSLSETNRLCSFLSQFYCTSSPSIPLLAV